MTPARQIQLFRMVVSFVSWRAKNKKLLGPLAGCAAAKKFDRPLCHVGRFAISICSVMLSSPSEGPPENGYEEGRSGEAGRLGDCVGHFATRGRSLLDVAAHAALAIREH